MASETLMPELRARAHRQVADNARTMRGGPRSAAPMTVEQRAKRWWDVPAKLEVAGRIMDEETRRAFAEARAAGARRPHNNIHDARRHARASMRIAEAAGPIFAEVAGAAHELQNAGDQLMPAIRRRGVGGPYRVEDRDKGPTAGDVADEIRMDLHNNAEGRRAARLGVPIDASRLRSEPVTPAASGLYRTPPEARTGLPPR
jgi:hypothetical protein